MGTILTEQFTTACTATTAIANKIDMQDRQAANKPRYKYIDTVNGQSANPSQAEPKAHFEVTRKGSKVQHVFLGHEELAAQYKALADQIAKDKQERARLGNSRESPYMKGQDDNLSAIRDAANAIYPEIITHYKLGTLKTQPAKPNLGLDKAP